MKKQVLLFFFIAITSIAYSQNFPGLNPNSKKKLLASGMKIPLPTWLPEGFKLDTFEVKTNKSIPVQDRVLYIQYTKKLNDSTWQSFMVEAGFDGLGSLWYESDPIQSAVGKIELYYQPYETGDNGKKEKQEDLILTEWFEVNHVSFHIFNIVTIPGGEFEAVGDEDEGEDKYQYVAISKDDFKKILQSLQVLK
jgi:hypothetical protein